MSPVVVILVEDCLLIEGKAVKAILPITKHASWPT